MKRQSAHLFIVAVLALLGPLVQKGRGDFVLLNDEQFTVNSYHRQGTLYDISRAFIVLGGRVDSLYAYNYSTVGVSVGSISYDLSAYDFSTVDISGGSVSSLSAHGYSDVDISCGSTHYLYAYSSTTVDICGGYVEWLYARDFSIVDISGGSVSYLSACDSSTVIFYGQNFLATDGLILDGQRVLGTGILGGKWFDGTRWAVNISTNDPTATILAVSTTVYCAEPIPADLNGDCKVDFADFAIMASSWLDCNLVPQSACWE
jgi:hypothetical protein